MYTVSAGGESDVGSIVNEQARLAATHELRRTRSQLVKRSGRQRLLAYLEER